ncbi:MAG: Ig-like domain-containing protein, partial [Solobacterium sp.]|nr:Ig-like domain-containing protein [Solobacterium sp.]
MRNYLNKLLKSLLVFFMLCCVVQVSAIDVQAANVQIQVRYGQSEARDMLTLINQFRLSTTENWQYNSSGEKITVTGLKPLVYDYDLEKYAMQRAAELALRMEHTRPNGMGTSRPNSNYSAFGENIAAGFGSYTTKESVMNGWKETNEPYSGQGHRRAMQSKNYTSVGIGHVIVNGGHYWVQIFGGPARSTTKTVANDGISIVNIDVKDSFINGLKANVNPNSMSINVNQSASLPNVETKLSFIKDIQTFGIAPVYNPKIVWSSSNTSIATVTGNTVKGLSVGKAILTATVSYANKTTSTTVEVNVKQPVTSIQLNKTDLKMNRYESETLTATVLPNNASDKSLSWSSSDTSIAKVSSTGMINARNAGTATITAKATDGSNVSATCKVTVVIPVTSIRSSESSKEVEKGNTYTPTITVYPENATNKKLNWSSSNSSVATVDTNGNITAKDFGDATITATSTDGSNVSKTISIHVPVLTTEI